MLLCVVHCRDAKNALHMLFMLLIIFATAFLVQEQQICTVDINRCLPTCRPDAKNALYLETIKRGDLLLNRVQKLSRVIDVD
jgi:hypothetical protein